MRAVACLRTALRRPPPTPAHPQAFAADSLQEDVYQATAAPLVEAALQGYNGARLWQFAARCHC